MVPEKMKGRNGWRRRGAESPVGKDGGGGGRNTWQRRQRDTYLVADRRRQGAESPVGEDGGGGGCNMWQRRQRERDIPCCRIGEDEEQSRWSEKTVAAVVAICGSGDRDGDITCRRSEKTRSRVAGFWRRREDAIGRVDGFVWMELSVFFEICQ